jgi:hypothetical protein
MDRGSAAAVRCEADLESFGFAGPAFAFGVVEAGPVGRGPDGAMILERTDLTDRMEF